MLSYPVSPWSLTLSTSHRPCLNLSVSYPVSHCLTLSHPDSPCLTLSHPGCLAHCFCFLTFVYFREPKLTFLARTDAPF